MVNPMRRLLFGDDLGQPFMVILGVVDNMRTLSNVTPELLLKGQ